MCGVGPVPRGPGEDYRRAGEGAAPPAARREGEIQTPAGKVLFMVVVQKPRNAGFIITVSCDNCI